MKEMKNYQNQTNNLKSNKGLKILLVTFGALVVILTAVIIVLLMKGNVKKNGEENKTIAVENMTSEQKYNEAVKLCKEGKYQESYNLFNELGDYEDSEEWRNKFSKVPTKMVVSESEELDAADSMGCEIEYESDLNGNITKAVQTTSNGMQYIMQTEYDSSGNVVKEVVNGDGNESVTEYEYDTDENLVSKNSTDSEGNIDEYKYDKNGNVIYYNCVREEWKTEDEYEYNEEGSVIREVSKRWDNDGELSEYERRYKYEYIYDEEGKLLKEICTEVDDEELSNVKTTEYKYDEEGRKIERVVTNEYGKETTIYEYNSEGYVVRISNVYDREDGNVEINEHEYEYDSNGNNVKESYSFKNNGEIINETYRQYSEFTMIYDPKGITKEKMKKEKYSMYEME